MSFNNLKFMIIVRYWDTWIFFFLLYFATTASWSQAADGRMDTIDFWVVPSKGQIRCIGHWQQWPWVEAGARKGTKIEGENYDATTSRLQVVSNNKFVHAQSLDNMQCRRSAKNFALSYLSPNCCISCSVNSRWNFLRFYGFFLHYIFVVELKMYLCHEKGDHLRNESSKCHFSWS